MEKPRKYTPATIAFAHKAVGVVQYALTYIVILFGCLVWKLSPNNLVAFFIITFVTSLTPIMLLVIMNWLALLALKCRATFQWNAPCIFAKYLFALTMVLFGKIKHGYEIHGRENLQQPGGGLVVYYHPQMPFDCLFLVCELILRGGQQLSGILNRVLVKQLSGLSEFVNFFDQRTRLVSELKRGQLCAVAPGGDIEGAFSENYELYWNGRIGFAEVAKECGVPVIPMFTVNSQDATPLTTYGMRDILKEVYNKTKRVICLPLLCFPVKLRIIIGEPLYCGKDESPADFAERVKAAIHGLRDKHQRLPGNLLLAILERFGYKPFNQAAYHRKSE